MGEEECLGDQPEDHGEKDRKKGIERQDCEVTLRVEEQDFVEDCFELLEEVDWKEAGYLYRWRIRDGILQLNHLGTLG